MEVWQQLQNFSTIISPQLCQIGQKNQIIYCIRGDFFTFDQAAPGADFLNLKLTMKQIPYYTIYMNSNVFQLH